MRLAAGERCSTWGARFAEVQLAAPRKRAMVRPAPQEAADADRAEPLVITSPECCDQNVIWRSSLSKIGNELSTPAGYFVLGKNKLLEIRLLKDSPPRSALDVNDLLALVDARGTVPGELLRGRDLASDLSRAESASPCRCASDGAAASLPRQPKSSELAMRATA
jgi:hypothetical protein